MLYNYYRGKLNDDHANDDDDPNDNVVESNSFKYKTSIIGNICDLEVGTAGYQANKEGTRETEIAVPLKYLGNFWRSLDIPLINCEVSLDLRWDRNCVITSLERRVVEGGGVHNSPTGATFKKTYCKLYVPLVTL